MGDVMRSAWVQLLLVASATGCFYVDPINERPTADIERVDPALPSRGDTVTVWAQIFDPDGDLTEPAWSARACDDDACDDAAFATGTDVEFVVAAPVERADGTPANRMRIELDVADEWGARTAVRQTVDINLDNASPTIDLQRQGHAFRGNHPVGVPVTIVGVIGDPDDPAVADADVPVQLFAPDGATLEDATLTPIDEVGAERRWELVADAPGTWIVAAEVVDPLGAIAERTVAIPVAADHPPCLAAAEPAFPPEGARIVLDARRRFAVLSVDDDLDPFPAPAADHPFLDAASFRWWLASPDSGGALAPLGVDGHEVELDPAWYAPGDLLTLRVEAVDREDRALCDAAMASCELVVGCAQRRTWTVEVR